MGTENLRTTILIETTAACSVDPNFRGADHWWPAVTLR